MYRAYVHECWSCGCYLDLEVANSNLAPSQRPQKVKRRSFEEAAADVSVRYKGSLDLLA